jgi:hypothetical protein
MNTPIIENKFKIMTNYEKKKMQILLYLMKYYIQIKSIKEKLKSRKKKE